MSDGYIGGSSNYVGELEVGALSSPIGYNPDDLAWLHRGNWQPLPKTHARPTRTQAIAGFVPFDPAILSWLPAGQYPLRWLRPHKLGDNTGVPFEALYRPDGLQWEPSDAYCGLALRGSKNDWSIYPLQPPAAGYDPALLDWDAKGQQPRPRPEIRSTGDFAHPRFDDIYRPEGLQWEPRQTYSGRLIGRAQFDQSIYPLQPPAAAYDPQDLAWKPIWTDPGRPEKRAATAPQIIAAFVPFDPAILSWQVVGAYGPRGLVRSARDLSSFLHPPAAATGYDPALLDWWPRGEPRYTPLPRRVIRAFQAAAVLPYNPADLSWLQPIAAYGRARARVARDLTAFLHPIVTPTYDPQDLAWRPLGEPRAGALARPRNDLSIYQLPVPFAPELLTWLSSGAYPGRALPQAYRDLLAFLHPIITPPFDPQNLEWMPSGSAPQKALPFIRAEAWVSDPITPPDVIVEAVRELGARLPTYYIHRIKRVRETVKELPAVVAILRELDADTQPELAKTVEKLVQEMRSQGVEWRDAYTEVLQDERKRAEEFDRIYRDDIAGVFLMLDLL